MTERSCRWLHFFVSASSKSNLLKQERITKFPAQGSFPDAGVPRAASRALYTVSLLGWLTMEAEMHLMVNKDRLPVWIFASHFAKESAHGQSREKQSQRAVFYSPGSKGGTIITKEYEDAPRKWWKIGNRKVYAILVQVTKEQYEAYMRPVWKEEKRQQRLAEKRKKREKAQEEHRYDPSVQGWDTPVSFEQLCETEYGFMDETGQDSLDEILVKEELLKALREELAKLEELDRTILNMASNGISEVDIGREVGLSQKGVNKRKHKLLEQLREQMKDYR